MVMNIKLNLTPTSKLLDYILNIDNRAEEVEEKALLGFEVESLLKTYNLEDFYEVVEFYIKNSITETGEDKSLDDEYKDLVSKIF